MEDMPWYQAPAAVLYALVMVSPIPVGLMAGGYAAWRRGKSIPVSLGIGLFAAGVAFGVTVVIFVISTHLVHYEATPIEITPVEVTPDGTHEMTPGPQP